jgi:hypothetical protein
MHHYKSMPNPPKLRAFCANDFGQRIGPIIRSIVRFDARATHTGSRSLRHGMPERSHQRGFSTRSFVAICWNVVANDVSAAGGETAIRIAAASRWKSNTSTATGATTVQHYHSLSQLPFADDDVPRAEPRSRQARASRAAGSPKRSNAGTTDTSARNPTTFALRPRPERIGNVAPRREQDARKPYLHRNVRLRRTASPP